MGHRIGVGWAPAKAGDIASCWGTECRPAIGAIVIGYPAAGNSTTSHAFRAEYHCRRVRHSA